MAAPDPALALGPVETEMLRDVRSRLNRQAVSDKALFALGSAFVTACTRTDMAPTTEIPAKTLSGALVVKVAATADLATLSRLVATLVAHRALDAKCWPGLVAAGAPQAILGRRLALGGREQPVEA
ncbi:MAG: hypothetical protein Q8L66_15635 [Caulobacter sp.]|nr:hypothetical protein [Caulobacter sp.]